MLLKQLAECLVLSKSSINGSCHESVSVALRVLGKQRAWAPLVVTGWQSEMV